MQGMAFERYDILRWYESDDTVFLLVDIKARVHDTGTFLSPFLPCVRVPLWLEMATQTGLELGCYSHWA